jgi:hypothetical protein
MEGLVEVALIVAEKSLLEDCPELRPARRFDERGTPDAGVLESCFLGGDQMTGRCLSHPAIGAGQGWPLIVLAFPNSPTPSANSCPLVMYNNDAVGTILDLITP